MKRYISPLLFVFGCMFSLDCNSQTIKFADSLSQNGFTVKTDNLQHAVVSFSISEYALNDVNTGGEIMKSVSIPGVFLPNNEGAPDLPVMGRFIAVPDGATVSLKVRAIRAETIQNINIAPAPKIPLDIEKGDMQYTKNSGIYSSNFNYPKQPANISEIVKYRGVDMVRLSVSPFQYNPVSKVLTINREMEIEIVFTGGNGKVGDDRLRSRWWDALLMKETLNKSIIPSVDFSKPRGNNSQLKSAEASNNYEYLIITADNPDFLSWADSIRQFRTQQGISTGVVTTTQVGGNSVAAIESYVNNAYNTWAVPPVAVLLLGDITQITAPTFAHPSGYPDFPSDNQYADVNGDDLPDMIFSRIPANDATQLQVMVSKFINYERNPPVKASFYNNPITALGWQTDRWFQLCSEVVSGYMKNVRGKSPVRINAVYSGDPVVDSWSTASNTSTIISYFGPSGRGYIPGTPQDLGGFSGGTTSGIITAVNNGSFLLLHRDHGYYQGWGEPSFNTTNVNSLRNVNNELPFVFSINCQTGAYQGASECLAEKLERYSYNGQNSGALGVIAPTEVSYSFLNDTYVWGVFDNLFPDFMPDKTTQYPTLYVMPAFANAAGKYFLNQSNWSGYGTTYQQVTSRLFHCYGDAFGTLFTEVPQMLTLHYPDTIPNTAKSFSITADAGSLIALTVNGNIVGIANGTGSEVAIAIPQLNTGDVMLLTVTKQNYFRYSAKVYVGESSITVDFSGTPGSVVAGGSVAFNDLTTNNPTSWSWSFPGGTPSSSTLQNPVITYTTPGTYSVTLTATNSNGSNTITKTNFIVVNSDIPVADFTASSTAILINTSAAFNDLSTNNPTSWEWSFPGGTPSGSTLQNPVVSYTEAGTYSVSLKASNATGSASKIKTAYITVTNTAPVAGFSADVTNVTTGGKVNFNDLSTGNPTTWLWKFNGGSPATSTVQNPSVSYTNNGIYDVALTVSNSNGSSTKTLTGYIIVSNGTVTYCTSSSLSATAEWISALKFGSVTKTSGSSLYSDFTTTQIPITPGSTVFFSATAGFSGKLRKEFWRIWIDFNNDGDFADAGETVYSGTGLKGSVSGSIAIPSNSTGQARMRVSMKYGTYPASCETFNSGEVEDYMLNFSLDAKSLLTDAGGSGLKIYPNPTHDFITIETGDTESEVFIYGFNGTLLKHCLVNNLEKVDMQELPNGIYLVKVVASGSVNYMKVIRQ